MNATTKPCGTRTAYLAGCRCRDCRDAQSAYQRKWSRARAARAYGVNLLTHTLVDAEPVRAHIESLRAAGMGWKRVAIAAGVSNGAMSKLLYGAAGGQPSRSVRTTTAARILAVKPDLAEHAVIDATGTRRRIQALVARGWSIPAVGRELGVNASNMHALLHRSQVIAATAAAVRDLYDRMWDAAPREDTWHARSAATRARLYAARHGWAPPMAWDDDAIDDPDASPAVGR